MNKTWHLFAAQNVLLLLLKCIYKNWPHKTYTLCHQDRYEPPIFHACKFHNSILCFLLIGLA